MIEILLKRLYTSNGNGATLGYFTTADREKLNLSPICFSLERPLLSNGKNNVRDNKITEINESCCINIGEYKATQTFSPKFRKKYYLLENVEGRSGILIHPANTILQLLGCIAPFDTMINCEVKRVVIKNRYLAHGSQKSLDALHDFTKNEDILLKITDNEPQLVLSKLKKKNPNLIITL
jgi:hypothetical protein